MCPPWHRPPLRNTFAERPSQDNTQFQISKKANAREDRADARSPKRSLKILGSVCYREPLQNPNFAKPVQHFRPAELQPSRPLPVPNRRQLMPCSSWVCLMRQMPLRQPEREGHATRKQTPVINPVINPVYFLRLLHLVGGFNLHDHCPWTPTLSTMSTACPWPVLRPTLSASNHRLSIPFPLLISSWDTHIRAGIYLLQFHSSRSSEVSVQSSAA